MELLRERYGRVDLCLKMFTPGKRYAVGGGAYVKAYRQKSMNPRKYRWSGSWLKNATRVQNLFAWHGLAPRVYDLVIINGKYPAQVTDWLPTKPAEPRAKEHMEIVARYGIYKVDRDGLHSLRRAAKLPDNYIGDQFVDFGRYSVGTKAKKRLKRRIARKRGKTRGYEAVEEFGLKGVRNMACRLEKLQLDECDFQGKTVLDIGCSDGAFMRKAIRRGAKRVVGVDKLVAHLTYQVNNWLGYWNSDVYKLSMPKDADQIAILLGIKQFDIVFGLSIAKHMGGFADWITCLCRDTLFWEGHIGEKRGKYEKDLSHAFAEVEWLGYGYDDSRAGRPLWRCRRPLDK